ncbi:hypothetical protein HELRODRAFT_85149 [Helobdella robusta]|uniref:Actin-related protein 2/3 complex subunit 5 n=1 Tax=Helobdella robusta TaxID=6412 RepID=T1G5T4_HELRO|nr:hypothetical protein HELRODRAFT_85149 [Helobdella robusta]ESN97741.1 hypothetical protein HELRODRAFT_85149 [Helobdella robusta]
MASVGDNKTSFRKVDVDEYTEEKFKEDDDEQKQANDELLAGLNETEIQTMLNQGKNIDALLYILNRTQISKNPAVKAKTLQLALKVMLSFKSSEIDLALGQLDAPQHFDLLMKYIYKGFEVPSEVSSAHLLTWHEKVFAIGGVGCIMRVLVDRKRF